MTRKRGGKGHKKRFSVNPDNACRNAVFLWCVHCGRTYRKGEYREVDGLQMCPYEGCDGDTMIDAFSWAEVRRHDPHLPVIPSEGVVYESTVNSGARVSYQGDAAQNALEYFMRKLESAQPGDAGVIGDI